MTLFKDTLDALKTVKHLSNYSKRYLIEIHSTKAITPRFAIVSDISTVPYKQWSVLKVING